MGAKKALSGAMSGAGAGAAFGPYGAIIGGVGGGLVGALSDDGPDLQAIYGDLDIPTVEKLIAAGRLNGTAYDQIREDPATREAQMRALAYLQNVGSAGGMDLQSRAAQDQAMQRQAQRDRAARMAVLNNMASRGMRGGGAELAASLADQQSSANANAMASTQAAAQARSRALQAFINSGQLGGQVRGQDWSNASQRAEARDAIARFNSQNARSAYSQNMDWQLAKARGMAGAEQEGYQRSNEQAGAAGYLGGGAYGALDDWQKRNQRPGGGSSYAQPTWNGPSAMGR